MPYKRTKPYKLTIDNIKDNSIYDERYGTLPNRIDFAWEFLLSKNIKKSDEDNKKAMFFLLYAFDLQDKSKLSELMKERELYKDKNPHYIPGKSPKNLRLKPEEMSNNETYTLISKLQEKEMLSVNKESKEKDRIYRTRYFEDEYREQCRVLIYNGLFTKSNQIFSTDQMISHEKPGYAAYTLNANGELSVFNHRGVLPDGIAHSSMNAGSPVVSAGELKIRNGNLISITTHSGHYQPSLFNVYRVLEHFSQNKVDISKANVILFYPPDESLNINHKEIMINRRMHYKISAKDIYLGITKLLNDNINDIQNKTLSYQEFGVYNSIFRLKDKMISSDFTNQRFALAYNFEQCLNAYKSTLVPGMTKTEMDSKITELNTIISYYQTENNKLSESYGKSSDTGRLSNNLSKFKQQLNALKDADTTNIDRDFSENMKKSL